MRLSVVDHPVAGHPESIPPSELSCWDLACVDLGPPTEQVQRGMGLRCLGREVRRMQV